MRAHHLARLLGGDVRQVKLIHPHDEALERALFVSRSAREALHHNKKTGVHVRKKKVSI